MSLPMITMTTMMMMMITSSDAGDDDDDDDDEYDNDERLSCVMVWTVENPNPIEL